MNDGRPSPYPDPRLTLNDLPGHGRHFVYHLCGRLPGVDPEEAIAHVYVGVTSNLRARLRTHARKWWWPVIDLDLGEYIEHPTRAEAEADEAEMIRWLQPAMNRAGRLLVVG